MPKISVVMPVFNAEKYVKMAVESILKQTFSDFELIIIDDKGTDHSIDIVENISDPRIKILYNKKNYGIAYSRNRGIAEAQGEYIALMDDDDYAPAYRLETEQRYLDTYKKIAVVGGARYVIDEKNTIIKRNSSLMLHNPRRIRAELIFHDVIPNGSAMMRNNFIRDYKIRYQDHMQGMEDYHFWVQCSLYGDIVNLDDVLLYWRKTDTNETYRRNAESLKKRIEAYKSIQGYALTMNRFLLTEEEKNCFFREFSEGRKYKPDVDDLNELFGILTKLIKQAEGFDFGKEMEYVCKYMFGLKVAESLIWERSLFNK